MACIDELVSHAFNHDSTLNQLGGQRRMYMLFYLKNVFRRLLNFDFKPTVELNIPNDQQDPSTWIRET